MQSRSLEMDWKMPFEPAFATCESLPARKRIAQAAHARGGGRNAYRAAQTESRHVAIDILAGFSLQQIGLMPDAHGVAVLGLAVEFRPGDGMPVLPVKGV